MSVTFSIARLDHDEVYGEVTVPADCASGGHCLPCCPCRAAEFNVSNTNAAMLLDRLGVDHGGELFGTIEPGDATGRALVANVGRDDSGFDAVTDGRITQGGLPEGYFEERFSQLIELAVQADRRGGLVSFC